MMNYSTPNWKLGLYRLKARPFALLARRFQAKAITCADIGAADGALGLTLLRSGLIAKYTGFELDAQLRGMGAARGLDMVAFDANRDSLPTGHCYDLILCTHIIEHLDNPGNLLNLIRRSLNPEGVGIIAAPNLSGVCARLRGSRWIGRADPTHINLMTHQDLEALIEGRGLRILYRGSSYLSDLPKIGLPIALASKILFLLFGFAPWRWGNSAVFVVSRSA